MLSRFRLDTIRTASRPKRFAANEGIGNVKSEIKLVVEAALGTDPSIPKESVSYLMNILEGRLPVPTENFQPMTRVIHRAEARKLLGVCDRSLDHLANQGKLVRVMGIGKRSIGFTEASVRLLAAAHNATKNPQA